MLKVAASRFAGYTHGMVPRNSRPCMLLAAQLARVGNGVSAAAAVFGSGLGQADSGPPGKIGFAPADGAVC